MTRLISLKQVKNINQKMAAVIGSVAAVVFLESDEDDNLRDITTSPAVLSFFNIRLLTDQNDFKKMSSSFFFYFMTVFYIIVPNNHTWSNLGYVESRFFLQFGNQLIIENTYFS